jgi:3'-phosphoadenosine 5'-phosphosulfate sulfotransferase (PAPS reductase)/FAD synthetase
MKTYISFSGGVESTTMCLLYGKGATAIWADTGAEHDEMYERIDECEKYFKSFHGGDFELIRLKASITVGAEKVDSLLDKIVKSKFMPSVYRNRYCTTEFKIKPIDDYLLQQGDCELLIGFNADEEPGRDRTGNYMKCKNVNYTYPLFEDGYTRDDCEQILKKHGMHPNFPIYMKRGGCFMCIFKDKPQYKAMYLFDKKTFDRVKSLEESIQDRRKRFFPIMAHTGVSMQMVEDEVKREIELWGLLEVEMMYSMTEQKQACGAFCHR